MLDAFTGAFVAFFVTVDPLGLVPIFMAVTRNLAAAERRRTAFRAVVLATLVLLLFAVFGESVLTGLGIGIPAFRIAGGLFLFLLALEMVFERRGTRRGGTAGQVAEEPHPGDLAVFPLAIPLIAGPAAITTTILVASRHSDRLAAEVAAFTAMLLVLALTWLAFRLGELLQRRLGPTVINVLSRLLGLLLGALAVQYVLDGLRGALAA